MLLRTGRSRDIDPARAAAEALSKASANHARPAFALVFGTDGYEPRAFARAVTAELAGIPWAGCLSTGVFADGELIENGAAVGLISADAHVGVGVGGPVSEDPRGAGAAAAMEATSALSGADPAAPHRSLIVLADALDGRVDEVVEGIVRETGAGISWAGGGVGDGLRGGRSASFALNRPYTDRVVVVAVDSSPRLAVGIEHGWRPYGPPTMVTAARAGVVVELEYESAFSVYERTVASHGDAIEKEKFAAFAMRHPLGIPQADGDYVIRDPFAVESDGSLRCLGEIPEGCLVRVMQGDSKELVNAARSAAVTAREALHAEVAGAFVFDCVSRFLLLGADYPAELEGIRAALGESVPFVGCLTLGEVGASGGGVPRFHNKTAVVLALPRAARAA